MGLFRKRSSASRLRKGNVATPPKTILPSFQTPSRITALTADAGNGEVPGFSQSELDVSAMRRAKRDFDFASRFRRIEEMGLQPAIDPGVAGKKVSDRHGPVSSRAMPHGLSVQGCQRHGGIRRMIRQTKVAAHDATVVAAVAACQIAKFTA